MIDFSIFLEKISQSKNLDDLYSEAINFLTEKYSFENGFLFLLNKDSQFEQSININTYYREEFNNKFKTEWIKEFDISGKIIGRYKIFKNIKLKSSDLNSLILLPLNNSKRTFGIVGFYYNRDFKQKNDLELYINVLSNIATHKKQTRKLNFVLETFEDIDVKQSEKQNFQLLADSLSEKSSKFNACIIHLKDQYRESLYGYVSSGIEYKKEGSSRVKVGENVIGKVYLDGKIRIIETEKNDFLFIGWAKKNKFKSMISIRLKDKSNKPYGVLTLFTKYIYREEEGDGKFLDNFVNQIATLINNLEENNYKKNLKYIDELISEIIPYEISIPKILELFVNKCLESTNADIGFISLLSKHSNQIKIDYKYTANNKLLKWDIPKELDLLKEGCLISHVFKNKKPYIYPSYRNNDLLRKEYVKDKDNNHIIESEIIIPLIFQDEFIGITVLSSLKKHAFSLRDLDFLISLSNKVAQVIQNKRLRSASLNLNQFKFEDLDEDLICIQTVEKAKELTDAPSSIIWLIDHVDGKEVLRIKDFSGLEATPESVGLEIMRKDKGGLSWSVINEVRQKGNNSLCRIFDDLQNPSSGFRNIDFAKKNGFVSMLCVPLVNNGEVYGILNVHSNSDFRYFEHDKILLKNLSIRCSSALMNAKIKKTNEDLLEKWTDFNVIANPGIIAISFVHDIRHDIHFLNRRIDDVYFSLIKETNLSKGRLKELIIPVSQQSTYIRKTTNTLINLSKRVKVKKKGSSLKEILDNLNHLFKRRLDRANIDFDYKNFRNTSNGNKDIILNCFPNEIEQLFFNMLLNSIEAFKYKTHVQKKIQIKSIKGVYKDEKEYIKIFFEDNGCGINKDIVGDDIFKFDFTTKDKGSGIGLGSCKGIIDRHEGFIDYDSREGFGTIFTMYFPII